MSPRPCSNCALFGREVPAVRGHTCVDVDPCPKCGGPRMLRVVEVYARGGVLREMTCRHCSRQRRALEAA